MPSKKELQEKIKSLETKLKYLEKFTKCAMVNIGNYERAINGMISAIKITDNDEMLKQLRDMMPNNPVVPFSQRWNKAVEEVDDAVEININ